MIVKEEELAGGDLTVHSDSGHSERDASKASV